MGGCACFGLGRLRGRWSRSRSGSSDGSRISGFSPSRIEKRLGQLGRLSGWLEMEGLRADELTVGNQQRFLGGSPGRLVLVRGSRRTACVFRWRICVRSESCR